MKGKIDFLILSIGLFFGYANSDKGLRIEYFVKNGECFDRPEKEANLTITKSNSLYIELKRSIQNKGSVNEFERRIKYNQVWKDMSTNWMYSKSDDDVMVKEEMNLFRWKFSNECDTILNYPCRKASSKFRGRQYEAWFTTELSFRAAPWKIHGLPGVVLKLESLDGFYLLKANKIVISECIANSQHTFKEEKCIGWDEYVEFYEDMKKQALDNLKALGVKYGKTYKAYYPKLEIIIEEMNREPMEVAWKKMHE
jgi:GLPGLI family protein